jgi:hypothetical protein
LVILSVESVKCVVLHFGFHPLFTTSRTNVIHSCRQTLVALAGKRRKTDCRLIVPGYRIHPSRTSGDVSLSESHIFWACPPDCATRIVMLQLLPFTSPVARDRHAASDRTYRLNPRGPRRHHAGFGKLGTCVCKRYSVHSPINGVCVDQICYVTERRGHPLVGHKRHLPFAAVAARVATARDE